MRHYNLYDTYFLQVSTLKQTQTPSSTNKRPVQIQIGFQNIGVDI